MSETKDQTIARLEGELKEANSEVERYRGNYRASQQELAASREIGPCGRHPNACYRVVDPKHLPGQVECTTCAELAASRADALERAAEISDCPQDMANQTATRICTRIRGLITPTDDTARAERERIRLEEAEWWANYVQLNHPHFWFEIGEKRIAELRAPVPAERAGDYGHKALLDASKRVTEICRRCDGAKVICIGWNGPDKECPRCHGTGRQLMGDAKKG